MKISRSSAVLATICYADIFDYPLTYEEMDKWGIMHRGNHMGFAHKHAAIAKGYGYVFLVGKSRHIKTRHMRAKWSEEKWRIARRVAWWLRAIPTIQLVGVTGAVAMNNAKREDDVDLFIITRRRAIWTTRLFATLLIECLGLRRRPLAKQVNNTVCLNMFVTEDALRVPGREQDLFTAHEVLQMVPLWERGAAYQRFLHANRWVEEFLPNAWRKKYQVSSIKYQGKIFQWVSLIHNTSTLILHLFEFPAKWMQLLYMRRHRTNEVITDRMLRFHPQDARQWIKDALGKRLAVFDIPLDKIFYAR